MRVTSILFVLIVMIFGVSSVKAQSGSATTNVYTASAGETIFSWGSVDAGDENLNNIVRFSPVFNFGQQLHFDFNNTLGFYTGLDLRNVGMITHTAEDYQIKERAYGLGLPLVIKIGNFTKNMNIGLGGELEMMFAYKQKIIIPDYSKVKNIEWFSDQVNIFNPSLLAEVKFRQGFYIRYKYYLNDFLNYQGGLTFTTPTAPYIKNIPDYAKSSQLMYVSVGMVVAKKAMNGSSPAKEGYSNAGDGFFRSVQ
ncbi:MAG: hypothetical protein ABI729_05320 [Chitinophagales bacterium]